MSRDSSGSGGTRGCEWRVKDRFLVVSGVVLAGISVVLWLTPLGYKSNDATGFAIVLPWLAIFLFLLYSKRRVAERQIVFIEEFQNSGKEVKADPLKALQSDSRLAEGLEQWFVLRAKKIDKERAPRFFWYICWLIGAVGLILGFVSRSVRILIPFGAVTIWTGFVIRELDVTNRNISQNWNRIVRFLPGAKALEEVVAKECREAEEKHGKKVAVAMILMTLLFLALVAFGIIIGMRDM